MQRLLRIILPIVVLGIGVAAFLALVRSKPAPQKKHVVDHGLLVETIAAERSKHQLVVEAQGTVVPAREVLLQPEVSGRVVWQGEELVPGGRFKQGEVVVRIDPSDYQLAAKQHEANVDRARLELRLEKSRQSIAADEWRILSKEGDGTEEGRDLVLRKPQLANAETNVTAAESEQRRAKLAVSRTVLKAPFNAFVQSESVDVGQLVGPQTVLARLVGTDAFWVQISVPMSQLGVLSVPGFNVADGEGSDAHVVQDVGAGQVKRTGRIIRLYGELDPVGKMARVLVELQDPLGLGERKRSRAAQSQPPPPNTGNGSHLPLLLGAYVDVRLEGKELSGVFELPRTALRDGDRVYVFGKNDRLEVRDVHVAWRREETVLVDRGIDAGDAVVVSRMTTGVAGTLLRRAPAAKKRAAAKGSP